jgi:hypothetical protein
MAELFGVDVRTINEQLQDIFKSNEFHERQATGVAFQFDDLTHFVENSQKSAVVWPFPGSFSSSC